MVLLQNINFSIGGQKLLDEVCFQISKNQHVALVGRNGSGKSTIFNIIQNVLSADHGNIQISKNWQILSIKQELPDGNLTPLEYILQQDKERSLLFSELENCEDANRMSEIYGKLLEIDAYSAESRAAKILKGLGFNDEMQNQLLKTFSGGFRMRVALGSILFQEPDLLLLDEPTNHLDLFTVQWLQKFLRSYSKSFLLISHERDFLNKTVEHILHLKDKKIKRYSGNFDQFINTYTMEQNNLASYNKKLEEKRNHMMKFVVRFRAKATKAKQARSRLKSIEKMQFIPVDQHDPNIVFQFPEPKYISSPLVSFNKVSVGYRDKIILKNISGFISEYDRIGLVGSNGSGKTTCARFLFGDLIHKLGSLHRNPKLSVAFYRQDQLEQFNSDISMYEEMQKHLTNSNHFEIRTHLARFGFSGDKVDQKVKDFSGGEKARLLFACLTAENPNLLILDEPTNHLDLEMRESLINALNAYKGAIVLITHDRYLIKHTVDTLWDVTSGTIKTFNGDISDYEKSLTLCA